MLVKDLINVGIFAAIYYVVSALSMIGLLNPALMLPALGLTVLANGVVIMLFFARCSKPGPLVILGAIIGLFMTLAGHAVVTLPLILVTAALAEALRAFTDRRKPVVNIFAYAIFSLWVIGPVVPIFYMADAYFADLNQRMADRYPGYGTALQQIVGPWTVAGFEVIVFVLGLLGAWIGHLMLRKHFQRAGVA